MENMCTRKILRTSRWRLGSKVTGEFRRTMMGNFALLRIKPGAVPGPDGKLQAPHIAVSVFMRGLLRRVVTRIYFPDEAENARDFVLGLVEAGRRGSLIAQRVAGVEGLLKWDVIMQGPRETVFFDC